MSTRPFAFNVTSPSVSTPIGSLINGMASNSLLRVDEATAGTGVPALESLATVGPYGQPAPYSGSGARNVFSARSGGSGAASLFDWTGEAFWDHQDGAWIYQAGTTGSDPVSQSIIRLRLRDHYFTHWQGTDLGTGDGIWHPYGSPHNFQGNRFDPSSRRYFSLLQLSNPILSDGVLTIKATNVPAQPEGYYVGQPVEWISSSKPSGVVGSTGVVTSYRVHPLDSSLAELSMTYNGTVVPGSGDDATIGGTVTLNHMLRGHWVVYSDISSLTTGVRCQGAGPITVVPNVNPISPSNYDLQLFLPNWGTQGSLIHATRTGSDLVQRYDIALNSWTSIGSLSLGAAVGCEFGGAGFIAQGSTQAGVPATRFYRINSGGGIVQLNDTPEAFDSYATFPNPDGGIRNHTVMTKIGGHIYAFCEGLWQAGTEVYIGQPKVWRYNGNATTTPGSANDSWTNVFTFPFAITPEFTVGPVSSNLTETTDAALIVHHPGGGTADPYVYLWKPPA